MYSTPEDIARFYFFSVSRSKRMGDRKILSGDWIEISCALRKHWQVQKSYDTYGIGWAIYDYEGHPIMAHAGGHWGFSAKAEVLPRFETWRYYHDELQLPTGNIGPDKDLNKGLSLISLFRSWRQRNLNPVFDLRKVDVQNIPVNITFPGDYAHADVRSEK